MAITTVKNELIAENAVSGTIIADNAITAVHIAQNAVTATQIPAGSITTGQLAADAVSGAKLADSSVVTANIQDDQVTGDKLADNITIAGTLGVTGVTTLATHLVMGDSDIIKLGAGSDLQIYHNGTHSYISDQGTGDLKILASKIEILSPDAGENIAVFQDDGSIKLFYDNSLKLETVTGGINITGDTDTDTLTVSGNATVAGTLGITGNLTTTGALTTFTPSSGEIFVISRDGTGPYIGNSSNHSLRLITNNAERMRITSAGAVTIGGTLGVTGAITGNLTGNASGTAATVTTAAQTNITSLGTLTTLTVDDITINGSTISDGGALTVTSGDDLTIDVVGDIHLDADGGDITFKDGGTLIGKFSNSSSDFVITSGVQDKDIIFKGDDGGSAITAMTIDMSAGGAVGIGTTSPDQKLSLKGAGPGFRIESSTNSTSRTWDLATETVAGGDLAFRYGTSLAAAPSVTSLILKGDGKIGIGVTDPDCRLEIGGTDAMSVPSGTTAQAPTPRDGMIRYDTTTEKFNGYVDGAWHTFTTASIQPDVQFQLPSTSHIRGTISAAGKIFTMSGSGYSGVSTNLNFEGNFIIITSWQHDYMGMGIAYKDDITNADFTGESDDSNGFYGGAASVDGFTSSTSFHGAYHAPSGQGGNTNATKHYFMHKRTGNVVRMDYSTNASAATDPDHNSWTQLIGNQTISSSNHVKPLWGEAGGGAGADPLRMLYTDVTGATNSD